MQIDHTTERFIAKHPDECSCVLLSPRQKVWYLLLVLGAVFLLLRDWLYFLTVANLLIAGFYFSIILFKLTAVLLSVSGRGVINISDEEIAQLEDSELPVYTILVPLYREANIADRILRNLGSLDYPPEKLDVKLLLEEDDTATVAAVQAADLPSQYDVIVVPDSMPKTKPKACNHGLERALGEYVVIYDAEDRPEPDQLKKACIAFMQSAARTVCLQARLNYFNPRQNLLTRWFTIEYTTWFDLFLPGLERMRVPIPLGGTSNHFKTEVLQEIGGWDPFNVTEDCDLGVRLYKLGYSTRLIASTTWEEANSQVWNWVRQRSRWIKGYAQTHLTHMRHPFRTLRRLGLWGMCGFFMSVGGLTAMLALNVVYWLIGGIYSALLIRDVAAGRDVWTVIAGEREALRHAWKMIYHGPMEDPTWSAISIVFFVVTVTLILANVLFILLSCLACRRRGYRDLLPQAVLSPFYWVLISVGAWKGFIQLFTNPFYWEKTDHGLDEGEGS